MRTVELRIIHISWSPSYRLRLRGGGYVFMAWHHYCGPEFYRDRAERRWRENWWDDPEIIEALDWFVARGERA